MQLRDGHYLFSATDMVGYLECTHLTALDLQSLHDAAIRAEKVADDESAALIARKGTEHELAYLQRLRASARQVVDIAEAGGSVDDKVARTLAAMADGAEVVYQATLRDGPLFGHADFLRRVDGEPSSLGSWRYGLPMYYDRAWFDLLTPQVDWTSMRHGSLWSILYTIIFLGLAYRTFRRKDVLS